MTKARRLLAVAAVLAAAAYVSSSPSWGEPADHNDRTPLLPPDGNRPAAARATEDAEAALMRSKLDRAAVVVYQPTAGDTLFALQLKPTLDAAKPRPRDYLIMVCTSASQTGAPWFAAKQLAKQ